MATGHKFRFKNPLYSLDQLCHAGYRDIDTGKHDIFLTNNFKLADRIIADIYKARWQVGLFFKWIKQNLKIKFFIGTSKNAVMTEVCNYFWFSSNFSQE